MLGQAFARAKFAAVVCTALLGLLAFNEVGRAQDASGATPSQPPAASPAAPAAPAATPATPPAAAGNSPAAPAAPAPPSTATPSPAPPAASPPTPPADNGAAPSDSASEAIELVGRPGAYIEGKSNWDEGFATLMGAIASINKELANANLKPAGRPLGIFLATDDAGFRYRAMVPLDAIPAGKTQLTDAIKFGQTPAGKAMKFEHRGSYEDIDSTYEAITAYLDEKGLEEQNLFYEEYLNDVKSPDDPTLEVDIYVLLK